MVNYNNLLTWNKAIAILPRIQFPSFRREASAGFGRVMISPPIMNPFNIHI